MPESVDILIAAENKASPVFTRVGDDAERLDTRVKETGRNVKASSELIGTFANVLGNTQFGGVAGQLAQLTERVSQFSEVSKRGAAGALAFKAGLVAAAAVVTYKTTETIASWWFEIDKAKAAAEDAAKSFDKMAQSLEKTRAKKFSETREDLSLIFDPADRERATSGAADQLERQAKEMQARIEREKSELARRQQQANSETKIPFVNSRSEADVAIAKEQLEASEALQKSLLDEAAALRDLVGERAKSIEARKKENAEKQEAIRKEEESRRKEEAERQRIIDLQDRELRNLEIKKIELEEGKEAARAYALEQEGLSKEFAKNIAKREAELEQLSIKQVAPPENRAVESRTLTRGPAQDPVLKAIEKGNEEAEKTNDKLEQIYEANKNRDPYTLKVVT